MVLSGNINVSGLVFDSLINVMRVDICRSDA
jgi:hypothetical protein